MKSEYHSSFKADFTIPTRSFKNWDFSDAAHALKRFQANPRVKFIILAVPADACTACQELAGTYPKDQVPQLPVELCSHPHGCRAYYFPYLDEIFP